MGISPAFNASTPDVGADTFQSLARGSLAMQIWFDDRIFDRAKQMATYLSRAEGFTPPHLIGKPEACFAVVSRSLVWRLDPFSVAQSTYSTPGGKVGFEGKLCQAILENSGSLDGPVEYEHFGDWTKVQGKFRKAKSDKGKDYAAPNWQESDESGLGVTVRAKVRGEAKKREFTFLLSQAFPRNSTLWATDPRSQICYTAVRRFCSIAAPGIFLGVPFDREDEDAALSARDINPRPVRTDFMADRPATIDEPVMHAQTPEPITDEDEAAADRSAAQFAMTGSVPEEEPEEVDEETGEIISSGPAHAEPEQAADQAVDQTAAPRANADFWARDSYAIDMQGSPKGIPNWVAHMRAAAGDAQTVDELRKLDVDNARSWQVLKLKMPDAHRELREIFAARAGQLS